MSRSVNKSILIGNVNQIETRYSAAGNPIVTFNLATEDTMKDPQSGNIVPVTDWHRVVLFGKPAEIASKYLTKGRQVYVCGKQKTRDWVDNDNIKRYITEVHVDFNGEFTMLGANPNPGQNAQSQQGQQHASAGNSRPHQRDNAPQQEPMPSYPQEPEYQTWDE